MKKTYIDPRLDLIMIGDEDVITTSSLINGDQSGEEITLPNIGDLIDD